MATTEFHPNQHLNLHENGQHKFLISYTIVTLNEGQGHPNWYQNVELSDIYHHTKFERNGSMNVWLQANVKIWGGGGGGGL